jgi:hypothetical protein
LAFKELPGGGHLICHKSKGHTDSKDAARREHFDPDKDERWTDD